MANIYALADTWNDSGTTFTGIGIDVTDTASAAGSALIDLKVGGVSQFKIGKTGTPSGTWIGTSGTKVPLLDGANTWSATQAFAAITATTVTVSSHFAASINDTAIRGVENILFSNSGGGPYWRVAISDGGPFLPWTNNTYDIGSSGAQVQSVYIGTSLVLGGDAILRRDAANTLALRNGTNAQAFNIYNTYTDGSNYERGLFRWTTNVLTIGTEAAGTGSSRNIRVVRGGSEILSITDVGLSVTGLYAWASSTRLYAPSDGTLRLTNNAETGFSRLQFGGTTNAFASLKFRDGTGSNREAANIVGLEARLADDSGAAGLCGARVTGESVSGIFTTNFEFGPIFDNLSGGTVRGVKMRSGDKIMWSDSAANSLAGDVDLLLVRDAANTLALRNGTSAQTLHVYGTYTDSSNYERFKIGSLGTVDGLADRFGMLFEKAGTGSARNFDFGTLAAGAACIVTNSVRRWYVNSAGHFLAITDAAYDIGGAGERPRDVHIGRHLKVAGAQVDFTGLPTANPAVAGRLWNDSGTVKISAG